MNATDVLKYGQLTVLGTLDAFPEKAWYDTGACGVWSVKDIIAHLASFEGVLIDVLTSCLHSGPTPALDTYLELGDRFNDVEVAKRSEKTMHDVLTELKDAHSRVMSLIVEVPPDTLHEAGTLPWYGVDYSLDDLLVYMYYGHKREHSGQIAAFRDRVFAADGKGDGIHKDPEAAPTESVIASFNQALNRHDVPAVMALMTDDCVLESTLPPPDGERLQGQDAVGRYWEALFRSSPQAIFESEEAIVHGDRCIVRWRYDWTSIAGQKGHVRGVDVFRVRDGKVAEKLAYVKG